MNTTTFTSAGQIYNMTINPAISATSGNKYPVIFLIHGNAGLVDPFDKQILGFAQDLAKLGYLTVVPEYYNTNNPPNFGDMTPHDQTLSDAIETIISTRTDVDINRLGLIGFSLGATTAMTYIVSQPQGTVKVLADFFGFLTPSIEAGIAKFPPTIILHNQNDKIVKISNSATLKKLLKNAHIKHQLNVYDENWLEKGHHPFKPSGKADVDSRKQTTDWFVKHL